MAQLKATENVEHQKKMLYMWGHPVYMEKQATQTWFQGTRKLPACQNDWDGMCYIGKEWFDFPGQDNGPIIYHDSLDQGNGPIMYHCNLLTITHKMGKGVRKGII